MHREQLGEFSTPRRDTQKDMELRGGARSNRENLGAARGWSRVHDSCRTRGRGAQRRDKRRSRERSILRGGACHPKGNGASRKYKEWSREHGTPRRDRQHLEEPEDPRKDKERSRKITPQRSGASCMVHERARSPPPPPGGNEKSRGHEPHRRAYMSPEKAWSFAEGQRPIERAWYLTEGNTAHERARTPAGGGLGAIDRISPSTKG